MFCGTLSQGHAKKRFVTTLGREQENISEEIFHLLLERSKKLRHVFPGLHMGHAFLESFQKQVT